MKHIISNENDLLQSEVSETISPQQEPIRGGTCSACFRSWSPEIQTGRPRGTLLHPHVSSRSSPLISLTSPPVYPCQQPCRHRVPVSMVTDLSNTLRSRKRFRGKRQRWESTRSSCWIVGMRNPKDQFEHLRFLHLIHICTALLLIHYFLLSNRNRLNRQIQLIKKKTFYAHWAEWNLIFSYWWIINAGLKHIPEFKYFWCVEHVHLHGWS